MRKYGASGASHDKAVIVGGKGLECEKEMVIPAQWIPGRVWLWVTSEGLGKISADDIEIDHQHGVVREFECADAKLIDGANKHRGLPLMMRPAWAEARR